MRSRRLRRLFALICLLAPESSCTHAPALSPATRFGVSGGEAPLVAVHVDHLQPGKLQAFADARRAWLDVLSKHATTDGRGLFLQTGDSGFLSLRPIATLGDLDRATSLEKAALASIDPKDLRAYDQASDALLAPPHRNEIWRFDAELSFGATEPTLALTASQWGKMTVEEIDPTPAGEAYDKAWKEIKDALLAQGYPLVRVSYWSRYGTGDLVSFWLAKSQREFLGTPGVEATVRAALGADAAEAVLARMKKTVLASDSIDVIPRLDLSSKAF